MKTPAVGSRTRRWRSRSFAQPLVITLIGLVASIVVYVAAVRLAIGPSTLCDLGPNTCFYYWAGAFYWVLLLLPVLAVGLLMTGVVVGRSTRDDGLAFGAATMGVVLPPLLIAVLALPGAIADGRDVLFRVASYFVGAVAVGLVLLVPIAIGFAVGLIVRPRPTDPTLGPLESAPGHDQPESGQ